MYQIATISDIADLHRAEEFALTHYLWGTTYQPQVTGRLAWVEGKGFALRMTCREQNPTRVYTRRDDPVYRDSCMEAFLNFTPDAAEPGYINFEMNANGAMLCAIGPDRNHRTPLKEMGLEPAGPAVQIGPDAWQLDLFIPLELLRSIYGPVEITSGYRVRGNFYKCGDATPNPHYGSWAKVGTEQPDFHRPEYFGEMVVE